MLYLFIYLSIYLSISIYIYIHKKWQSDVNLPHLKDPETVTPRNSFHDDRPWPEQGRQLAQRQMQRPSAGRIRTMSLVLAEKYGD